MDYINTYIKDFKNIDFKNIGVKTSIYTSLSIKLNNSKYKIKKKKSKKIKKYLTKLGYNNIDINKYYKLNSEKNEKTGKTKFGDLTFFSLNSYLYPFSSITSKENRVLRKVKYNSNKKSIELNNTIRKYLNDKKNEISLYYSHTLTQYRLYDILNKYKLLPNKNNLKSAFTFQLPSLLPVEDYYIYRENMSELYYYDNVDIIKIIKEKETNVKNNSIINKYKKLYNLEYKDYSNNFCIKDYKEKEKYDFIYAGGYIYDFNNKLYTEYLNSQNIFCKSLFILQTLKTNGNAVLTIGTTMTKITLDIIIILSSYFEEIYIDKSILMAPLRTYKNIVLKKFKGISNEKITELYNIQKEWYSYDNSGGFDWDKNQKFHINSLVEKGEYKIIENQIKLFNILEARRASDYFKYIFFVYNTITNYEKKDDVLNILFNIIDTNIMYSKLLLDKLKIPIITIQYDKKNIVSRIFKSPEIFNFLKTNKISKELNNTNKKNKNMLIKAKNELQYVKRSIDSRESKLYSNITKKLKFYNNLKRFLSFKFDFDISYAFLKMTEILNITKLIKYNSVDYKTFSLCEAPGQFILAINYYLKTNTKNKNYDWYSNSLNPEIYNNVIDNRYGLIKKYKQKWLFGKDNTGDITNIENIKYIKTKIPNDINLITSDCGKPQTLKTFIFQEKEMVYLNLSQIRAALYLLPLNNNFIFKTFLPLILPINISLIYILYKSFKEISLYKPTVNPSSSEIYFICKKYNNNDIKIINKLFKITEECMDINKYIIPISKYFIDTYSNIISKMINNNKDAILLSLSIYDKYKNNFNINYDKKNIIDNWIKTFNFKINKKMINL